MSLTTEKSSDENKSGIWEEKIRRHGEITVTIDTVETE